MDSHLVVVGEQAEAGRHRGHVRKQLRRRAAHVESEAQPRRAAWRLPLLPAALALTDLGVARRDAAAARAAQPPSLLRLRVSRLRQDDRLRSAIGGYWDVS